MTTNPLLSPPWIELPGVPLRSAAWRMGHGEEYWFKWREWYLKQTPETQTEYRNQFPEPQGWEGFYERTKL